MSCLRFLLVLLLAVPAGADELRIMAATTDVGAIARAVVGDEARIDVVARPDRDPHSLQVRPSTLQKASRADAYLSTGLQLDYWSDQVVRGSRNRNLVVIDCSRWIDPLEVPDGPVDASMGDVHPDGNPHWWLDPVRAVQVARGLAGELGDAYPDRADELRQNADTFASEVEGRLEDWRARLEGVSFVEYHRSWAYFADRFGMVIVARVEALPGIPPSARHLAEISEALTDDGARIVVYDAYHSTSPIEFLERETGVTGVLLPTACAEPTVESYLAHLEEAVEALAP